MKKERVEKVNNKYIPQSRFMLLWLIPTPFWRSWWNWQLDFYGEWILAPISFTKRELAENYLKQKNYER